MRIQEIQAAVTGGQWIAPVVILLVGAGIATGIFVVVNRIRNKMRQLAQAMFGTDSFVEGINRQADVLAETPKSVSGMTRIFEPQIMRDFPDFSWNEFRNKAENMLMSALLAISAANVGRLSADVSEEVKKQIENRIRANEAEGARETFSNVRIHQTEIANYMKAAGKCIITIQSAVEYYYYKEKNGKVTAGQKERKTQAKYNIELLYIQDARLVGGDNAVGATCPNCGAPIINLGNMYCEYCGSGVTPVNIKVWALHKFYEVNYNRL